MPEPKISVVIHTLNSARFLERVLQSVAGFDEVLICDMHSSDGTLSIAAQYACTVVMHEPMRFVEPARNFAIQQARHDWVLVVDSDELVKPALRDYLYALIRRDEPPVAVRIPRENFFMGRWMRSDYPDHIVRFFRKDSVDWPSHVHQQPVFSGRVLTIPGRRREMALVHLANSTIAQRLEKVNLYTDLEVERREPRTTSPLGVWLRSWHRFAKSYLLKGGFRDGVPGYIHARLQAEYKFITLSKLWEAAQGAKGLPPRLGDENPRSV